MGSAATYAANLAAQIASIGIQVSYAAQVARTEQEVYNQRTAMVDTLAKQVQSRADEKHQLWQDSYKDCEIAYIREVCAGEPEPLDYGVVRQVLEQAYRPAFSRNVADARDCLDSSCAPTSCAATRALSLHQAAATAWGLEGALRAGEDEHRLSVAQANERMAWVINKGNGHFGNTAGGTLAAAGIYARLANNAGESANGALAFLGASLRGLNTLSLPEPTRRSVVVPRPSAVSRPTPTTVAPTSSRPDLYDAGLSPRQDVQMVPAPAPDPGPDPYDNRFPRHVQTDYEDVPEDPDAPLGGPMGRGRDMPWYPPK